MKLNKEIKHTCKRHCEEDKFCKTCAKPMDKQVKQSDLLPFKHGEEGTHSACNEMVKKFGGKVKCCECTGHKCQPIAPSKGKCSCDVCKAIRKVAK